MRVPNAAGDKAALFTTIGPQDRGGVVLSGHTDVVPVTGQAWTSDPFRLRAADGRLFGRGAVDMKGFCALALALVPEFLAADLKTPIHLMLSFDEETTCLGVVDTIRRFGRDLPMPRIAIVGEPTELAVVDAHKSVVTFHTFVHGFEAHSAKPALGANAVMAAGELVAELGRIADLMRERGDPSGRFDPPYTSVHVGTIAGGTARNILAKEARFHWEFRGLPSLDPAEIPERFARFAREVALPRLNRFGDFGRIETNSRSLRPRPRAGAGLRRRNPRQAPRRPQPHRYGALRHRGRPLPGRRHPDHRLRPRLDRPGAPAGRVHRAGAVRGRRGVPAKARGRMRDRVIASPRLRGKRIHTSSPRMAGLGFRRGARGRKAGRPRPEIIDPHHPRPTISRSTKHDSTTHDLTKPAPREFSHRADAGGLPLGKSSDIASAVRSACAESWRGRP